MSSVQFAAILVPIVVVAFGYVISRRLRKLESQQWRSQELIAARLRYYREIAEPLNDLMCYFTFIGPWKKLTPPDVISLKRSLDKTFYTLVPFFDVNTKKSYDRFMDLCFASYGRWGEDARLRPASPKGKQPKESSGSMIGTRCSRKIRTR